MSKDPTEAPWVELRHPLVRNLAWCIFSPSLAQKIQDVSSSEQDASTFCISQPNFTDADRRFLSHLDQSPTLLQEWMTSNHTTRLGFQFEYYWQFWWRYRQAELEHRYNVQLTRKGKTLGELDALSWSPASHELTHSEMAVKFYLGIESSRLPAHKRSEDSFSWVGPNIVDRFDLKWEQLSQRQLRNLQSGEINIEDILPNHWKYSKLNTQLIMRGRLFYPFDGTIEGSQLPYINPDHHRGIWMRQSQFSEHMDNKCTDVGLPGSHWVVLQRSQWFAPVCMDTQAIDDNSHSCASHRKVIRALNDHFEAYRQPIQVAVLILADGLWQETERIFVVPDQWPTTT